MEFVMGLCHQVTVLDYGTVVAAGPPDIIAHRPAGAGRLPRRWRGRRDVDAGDSRWPDERPALTVEGLCAGYGGGDILHDVSFRSPRAASPAWSAPTGPGSPPCWPASAGCCGRAAARCCCAASRSPGAAPARSWAWAWCTCPSTTACSGT